MKHPSIVAAALIAVAMVVSAWVVAAAIRDTAGRVEHAFGITPDLSQQYPATRAARPGESDLLSLDEPLRAGDVVEFTIYDLTGPGIASTRTVRLGSGGKVPVPFVGEVPASGLTPYTFEKAIGDALRDHKVLQNPLVSVSVHRPG